MDIKVGDTVRVARASAHWGEPHWEDATVLEVNATSIRVKLDHGRFFSPSGTERYLRLLENVEWDRGKRASR